MPDRPATVAAYAAGASLAAITLFYVFGPNFTIDGEESSNGARKKNIVGLANPANDCFINSVLQALAGLGDLRLYLIRELHRRELDGPEVYNQLPDSDEISPGRSLRPDRIRELQQGTVTLALKEMLDRLNERPIYKKTISARSFIEALEYAFRTRISRNQQDAQEFLQIVAERLCDEYHAGLKARKRALQSTQNPGLDHSSSDMDGKGMQEGLQESTEVSVRLGDGSKEGLPAIIDTKLQEIDNEDGFTFEGQLESQIECQFCHYSYRPNKTSFVNLTLQVPQTSSATLNSCFDGLLKTEYIDDFRCDKCRLQHALDSKRIAQSKATSKDELKQLDSEIARIQDALDTDPEHTPEGVNLPAAETAPKRRIARHMRITVFPKIIAIHLSRSIFDNSSSSKNAAKVSFPERLPLGGILDRKWYKLLGIVCHKGSHNSGHYESFRRNHVYAPFSTPDVFRSYAQSRATSANPSAAASPHISAVKRAAFGDGLEPSPLNISPAESSFSLSSASPPSPDLSSSTSTGSPSRTTSQLSPPQSSPSGSSPHPRRSLQSIRSKGSFNLSPSPAEGKGGTSTPSVRLETPKSSKSSAGRTSLDNSGGLNAPRFLRRRKPNDRWWRISDEKVKECKTTDVLGMQKEVYLLFYELERPSPTSASKSQTPGNA